MARMITHPNHLHMNLDTTDFIASAGAVALDALTLCEGYFDDGPNLLNRVQEMIYANVNQFIHATKTEHPTSAVKPCS